MTNEEIQEKADQLSIKFSCKVHPLVFGDTDDQVIGYIKEPPRFVKLRVMDKGLTAPASAASEIVEAFLIKEESDRRIHDETADDKFYLGAVMEAYNMVSMSVNQFKKK